MVIYAACLTGSVWIGTSVGREGVHHRFGEVFPRRSWAMLSIAMSVLLSLLWLQRIAAALGGDLVAGALNGETTMTVPVAIFTIAALAGIVIGVRMYRSVGPAPVPRSAIVPRAAASAVPSA